MISAKEKDAPKTEFVLNYVRAGPLHAFDTVDQHPVLALANQAPFERKMKKRISLCPWRCFPHGWPVCQFEEPPAGLSSKDRRRPPVTPTARI